MSVENTKIIDFVTETNENINLIISDHLEWDNDNKHLLQLQEKINAYLVAIESGQLNTKFPSSVGKKVAISVALKYEPNEIGIKFFRHVSTLLSRSNYFFSYYTVGSTSVFSY